MKKLYVNACVYAIHLIPKLIRDSQSWENKYSLNEKFIHFNLPADTSSKSISEEKSNTVRKENGTSKAHTKNQPAEDVVKNMARIAKKLLSEEKGPDRIVVSDRVMEKMANDLYYQFNYTITSHGHQEDGYRDGRKDGSYRSQHENGVDTQVRYLSNEFGHQPNITFVPQANVADNEHALKGYSFRWYWS